MESRSVTDILMDEHRLIERMIAVMSRDYEHISREAFADPEYVDHVVDFMRTFADRCHHGKEEGVFFRRVLQNGVDADLGAALNELVAEHAIVRDLTNQLAEANERYRDGDDTTITIIEQSVEGLVNLYPAHIAHEEDGLFDRALSHLSDEERSDAVLAFDIIERGIRRGTYEDLVESLERRVATSHLYEVAPRR